MDVTPPLGLHPVVYVLGTDIWVVPFQQTSLFVVSAGLTATGVMLFPFNVIRTHFRSVFGVFQGHEVLSSTTERNQVVPVGVVVHGTPTVLARLITCSWHNSLSKYGFGDKVLSQGVIEELATT